MNKLESVKGMLKPREGKCKLSMQGSQALRSVETRTDSDRYAELRKLVEAWQSHTTGSSQALADWRHR